MGQATRAFLRLLAAHGEAIGWAPKWFFYYSQAAKLNAALVEGNYKKVVAVTQHVVRLRQHGQHVVEMHPAALDEARQEPAAVAAACAAASGD